ncbi:MAG TPA: bifunctional YncE family protein/alkaline phosphatase family protein [Bacteroidota bacterium]|jgi:YVTN family beta-propeller protein|nr:bifunctional YncE family protein/alkaline phosphatase family protein [Bacteroidota bacterium]
MSHSQRLLLISGYCFVSFCLGQTPGDRRIDLPNGWHLTPAGRSIPLGDLPLNIAVSPNGSYAAVTNNGQSDQSIELIDVKSERVLDSVRIDKSWLGLQFSGDGTRLYASGGNNNKVVEYTIRKNKLKFKFDYPLGKPWPKKISPSGLAVDDVRHRLYVVTKDDSSLYIFKLNSRRIVKKLALNAEAYTCLLSPDQAVLYISGWGGGSVIVYDTKSDEITGHISVGRHPNDMCLTKDGRFLYVANADDNSVSVADLPRRNVIETLNAALYPDALQGSTTNSVTLSGDDRTLYIANADNNCLAVFDVGEPGRSSSKGFIPTGWYPTCVRMIQHTLWVTNGKGFQSLPDPSGPNPSLAKHKAKKRKEQYIGSLLRGTMSLIPEPDEEQLAEYSQAVYRNTPYVKANEMIAGGKPGNPIPMKVGDPSPLHYVFYVIKENRTYDQVLGDDPNGNGDSSLCLFPRNITPNEHALADEFVLLDNFYVDAEVSADGHNWSMAAYANDYVEKTWPTLYGDRGGDYDYAGGRSIAFPKNGFLWDNCRRHTVTLRNYGEFVDQGPPPLSELAQQTCLPYPGWNLNVLDTLRENIWEKDFDSLLAAGKLPRLNIIYFPNDHTSGLSKGAYTPFAAVADNDLALGKFIDHLSHSTVWKESAVFVLEDDAQNGPDHVDAHRSIAFVAGAFVRRGFVDHTMYSTSSVLRTMELILGMPPMSQYDAAAASMWRCFSDSADDRPFTARPANVDLSKRNIAYTPLMEEFEHFDLGRADNVPDLEFNRLLWRAVKGEGAPIPPLTRSAFVRTSPQKDDD